MRVLRASGENISPSDDGTLFNEIFSDGLFYDVEITSLGSNQVSIPALYGIIQGREFTNSAETLNVELPASDTATGYIYVQYDFAADPIGTIESTLAPFTPTVEDINSTGTLVQMIIATYTASAVAVNDITMVYDLSTVHGTGTEIEMTLAASSWSSNEYVITDAHITPSAEITLTYPPSITDAQFSACQDASIRPYGAVSAGSLTLKANGGAPSIDLPLVLIIKG